MDLVMFMKVVTFIALLQLLFCNKRSYNARNMMETYSFNPDAFCALQCELLKEIPERLKRMYISDAIMQIQLLNSKDNKELINFYQIEITRKSQMMQQIKLVI